MLRMKIRSIDFSRQAVRLASLNAALTLLF